VLVLLLLLLLLLGVYTGIYNPLPKTFQYPKLVLNNNQYPP
jgi:hypothetical protein